MRVTIVIEDQDDGGCRVAFWKEGASTGDAERVADTVLALLQQANGGKPFTGGDHAPGSA